MKIYGLINGIFYILYGLYGAFMPKRLSGEVMGWTPDLLGLHQIRAMWMGLVGVGVICVMAALRGSTRALTQAIVLTTFCFMAGRVLGLALDGTGPQQTYVEIAIEVVVVGLGLVLLYRANAKA